MWVVWLWEQLLVVFEIGRLSMLLLVDDTLNRM